MKKSWLIGFAALIVVGWMARKPLRQGIEQVIILLLAWAAGSLLFMLAFLLRDAGTGRWRTRISRRRLRELTGFPAAFYRGKDIRDLCADVDQRLVRVLAGLPASLGYRSWVDAGMPASALIFTAGLLILPAAGFLLGWLLTDRVLLSVFLSAAMLIGSGTWLLFRARIRRREFQDQIPELLERLADSLQAGFSLPQAVEFLIPNLPPASSAEMAEVCRLLSLGRPLSEALDELYGRHPGEEMRLLVESIKLHQQVGGDVGSMIRELSDVIRGRMALEKEVKTLTAQGRLSAAIITLLVPVSLVILAFFPGYIDVLFETTPGNLVLITAVVLDGVGALIVRRLIQIEV